MLNSVDVQMFATAIKQSYKLMTDVSATNLAEKLIQSLNDVLEPAVLAWIAGKEVPNIEAGKYSITKILAIRNSSDYLDAFKLLSEYIQNPEKGEKSIWQPTHGKR